LGRCMMNDRVPVTLLAASLVLMASGSLRDLVTPLGYWAAWGAWAAVSLLVAYRRGRAAPGLPVWVVGSCAVLWLGMIVAAVMNRDWATAYQAMKIAVIAGMFVAMWRLVARLDGRQLVAAADWAVGVVLLGLTLSKIWSPAGQALLAGPREGSFLAVYGVLWKAGAFFLPVFLAEAIENPAAWLRTGLRIAACIFLVLIDGSRTGLLLLGAIVVSFLAFVVWRGGWSLARRQLRWAGAAFALLLVLQLLNTGANLAVTGKLWAADAAVGSPSSGSVAMAQSSTAQSAAMPPAAAQPATAPPARVLEGALNRTFETRIGAGDPARIKLLRASLDHVGECLPLGCGFGAMGTDIGTGWMVVHNAYLAALGDFGVLGLAGMLGFLVAAWLPVWQVLRRRAAGRNDCFVVAAAGSALAYGMALMLNTFTTEMSEWGYLIVMLAFAWAPAGDV